MKNKIEKTLFDAAAANGVSPMDLVSNFRHLVLSIDGASTPGMTVRFVASMQHEAPDFSAAQSAANQWDYVEVKDLEDGSAIDGDVGIVFSGVADNRHVEVNSNAVRWFAAVISGYTAGSVTVRLLATTD